MTTQTALEELKTSSKRLAELSALTNLLQWDLRTGAPVKSLSAHSAWMAQLSEESRRIIASERMGEVLALLSEAEGLSEAEAAMVREAKRAHARKRNVPPERLAASVAAISVSEAAWAEARKTGDWESFRPHLAEVIAFQRELAGYYAGDMQPYDALLDQYEPGCTTAMLDPLFDRLGKAVTGLLDRIRGSEVKIDRSFLRGNYPEEARKNFVLRVLREMGFDFEAGRLDKSAHPFTACCGEGDVRITAAYPPDELSFTLFAAIHEGGHGIYEQNVPEELKEWGLGPELSMGLHESQSRFYENIVGRSRAFWAHCYPALRAAFPSLMAVSPDSFYRGINAVEPGLIRTAADEVTYNLHIIVRYELEKALISGDLPVNDLPGAWAEQYRQYLGVTPMNHGEGVLQDTHWAAGAVGYFPSYALGNLYSAQLAARMGEELGNTDWLLARGELIPIREWLTGAVHRYGGIYPPAALIEKATGKAPGAEAFIDYLNRKYGEIYGL